MAPNLEEHLGKSIVEFCGNGFVNRKFSHNAHYVGHALGLEYSYNCKQHRGGRRKGASIRAYELFSHCPRVGHWDEADTSRSQLIFAAHEGRVNLSLKKMANHGEQAVGIFHNGMVYYYSDDRNKVVKKPPRAFLEDFNARFYGAQSLFYGLIPGSILKMDVSLSGNWPAKGKRFLIEPAEPALKPGLEYHAWAEGEEPFFIGRSEKERKNVAGLRLENNGPRYSAEPYLNYLGHWANILEVIGYCESGNYFNTVNSCTRKAYSFGFFQMSAATPRGQLICFFRNLLHLRDAKEYFPELKMKEGRIRLCSQSGGEADLEVAQYRGKEKELPNFMAYLKPSLERVGAQELLQTARLVHWANHSPAFRALQVQTAFDILTRRAGTEYIRYYRHRLECMDDVTLAIICDIHHSGRATPTEVRRILDGPGTPEQRQSRLMKATNPKFSERNDCLQKKINEMKARNQLGGRAYDPANNCFNKV